MVFYAMKRTVIKSLLAAAVGLGAALFAPLAAADARASEGLCVVNVASWDVLNVRSGPGTRFSALDGLAPGRCGITVRGSCQGNWCPIAYKYGSGWVNTRYLGPDGGGGIGGGHTANLLGDGIYCPQIHPSDVLNVREGPGVGHAVVGGFRHDYCNIRGTGRCAGNWCQVATHEFTGWVNTRYLRNVEGH